jgi:hypothetical protein
VLLGRESSAVHLALALACASAPRSEESAQRAGSSWRRAAEAAERDAAWQGGWLGALLARGVPQGITNAERGNLAQSGSV